MHSKPSAEQKAIVFSFNEHWADLNAAGNALAVKVLRASKRKNGCFVEVVGVLKIEPLHAIEVGEGTVSVTPMSEKWSIEAEEMEEKIEPPNKWSI